MFTTALFAYFRDMALGDVIPLFILLTTETMSVEGDSIWTRTAHS